MLLGVLVARACLGFRVECLRLGLRVPDVLGFRVSGLATYTSTRGPKAIKQELLDIPAYPRIRALCFFKRTAGLSLKCWGSFA